MRWAAAAAVAIEKGTYWRCYDKTHQHCANPHRLKDRHGAFVPGTESWYDNCSHHRPKDTTRQLSPGTRGPEERKVVMPKTAPEKTSAPLMLWAATAADLMTPNPLSISENATLREVVTFLTEKGFSAAPVIDEAGRPVGVVSQADIVI